MYSLHLPFHSFTCTHFTLLHVVIYLITRNHCWSELTLLDEGTGINSTLLQLNDAFEDAKAKVKFNVLTKREVTVKAVQHQSNSLPQVVEFQQELWRRIFAHHNFQGT